MHILENALQDVLACPACKMRLTLEGGNTSVSCALCQRIYPIIDDIIVFLGNETLDQEDERRFRDIRASKDMERDVLSLFEVIGKHHCIPVMQRQAEEFRRAMEPQEWLLDIGIGYGWHWSAVSEGTRVIGVDISLGNLKLARRILGDNDSVLLVCADAAMLPIRDKTISSMWSVQAFQHFPQEVFCRVQSELARVLCDEFLMEICNLNPAWLHRMIYYLCGKPFHYQGRLGEVELNRLSAGQLAGVWRPFCKQRSKLSCRYSELFFHPDFHLRTQRYPLWLELFLVAYAPRLAGLFARQVHVRLEMRSVE